MEEGDYLVMDLASFGKAGKRDRENICGVVPLSPSLAESRASKVVADRERKVSEGNVLMAEQDY